MPTEFRFSARPLSASETLADIEHACGGAVCIHVASLHSTFAITEALLHQSLLVLADYQPALRMRIATEKSKTGIAKRRFVEMEKMIIDSNVAVSADRKSWLIHAEDMANTKFETENGPLWKVMCIENIMEKSDQMSLHSLESSYSGESTQQNKETFLIFSIHSAIADGVSMFELIQRQLVDIINCIQEGFNLLRYRNPLVMYPSADESFNNTKATLDKPKTVKSPAKNILSDESITPTFTCPNLGKLSIKENKTRLLPFTLSTSATSLLIQNCETHNTDVQIVLLAICAHALSANAKKLNFSQLDDVTVGYDIDLRQFHTPHDPEPLANWGGYGISKVKCNGYLPSYERFWETVEKVRKHPSSFSKKPWKILQNNAEALEKYTHKGKLSELCDRKKVHIELSSIGDCDVKRNQVFFNNDYHEIESNSLYHNEHFFSSSISSLRNVSLIFSLSIFRKRLSLTLSYNERWINRSFAVKLIDNFISILKNVVQTKTNIDDSLLTLPPFLRAKAVDSHQTHDDSIKKTKTNISFKNLKTGSHKVQRSRSFSHSSINSSNNSFKSEITSNNTRVHKRTKSVR